MIVADDKVCAGAGLSRWQGRWFAFLLVLGAMWSTMHRCMYIHESSSWCLGDQSVFTYSGGQIVITLPDDKTTLARGHSAAERLSIRDGKTSIITDLYVYRVT